jgi:pyridoxine 4-dehydrogenase
LEEIGRASQVVKVAGIQNAYNIANRKDREIVEYCEKEGLVFIPYFPLGSGSLAQANGELDEVARRHNATPSRISIA